jgi:dipeptidyl aminopeptidase/acylaminoacyl peptidase
MSIIWFKIKNERQSAIWLLQLDEHGLADGVARQLTSGFKMDTCPMWSPDSRRLLFLSDREEEKNQLWLIDADGGEASRLTNMLNGVREAVWSPDGHYVAFTAMAASTDDDDLLVGRKALNADEKKKREGNRAGDRDRSFINALWAISCETGEARRLSDGSLEIESYFHTPHKSPHPHSSCIQRMNCAVRLNSRSNSIWH